MRARARPIVTLLTDFGLRDAFVGTMKGVILSRCPGAQLVDLTHELDPGDVLGGALLLRGAAPYFPPGTIHLAVVDPGVGGPRRPLAIAAGGQFFVGPDNGLLWPAAGRYGRPTTCELRVRLPEVSATFHGRDIFAPAAAALAAGEPITALGPPCEDPHALTLPQARCENKAVLGEVLWVDRFGNAITNLEPDLVRRQVGDRFRMRVAGTAIPAPSSHYAAVPEGTALVVAGSLGYYEIAVNRGNAAAMLGLSRGTPVTAEAVRERGGSRMP